MIQRIKRGDKLFVTSKDIDVIAHLKPNEVSNKYIELAVSDLKEVVKDVAGKTQRSFRLPVMTYSCNSGKLKPQTFAVSFNPIYGMGIQWTEAAKDENILIGIELPSGKLATDTWLMRIYLLDADAV